MQTQKATGLLLIFSGIAMSLPCLFFLYYSLRLLYVNLTMTVAEAEVHRTGGMLIGAFAFPIAAILLGILSLLLIRSGIRRLKKR